MRKLNLFFLILILAGFMYPFALSDFGESSTSLGQFVDEFSDLNNVSVQVEVVRNATYSAMELNGTVVTLAVFNLTQLKEQDFYGTVGAVSVSFSIANNDEIRMISTIASQGRGHMFLTADRAWLDGLYVRFRYYPQSTIVNPGYQTQTFAVWDGDYDRSSATDFPVINWPGSQPPPFKGSGSLFSYTNADGLNAWFTKDFQIDTTAGILDNCTLWFWLQDAWAGTGIGLYLDWIEINTGAGGTGNILTINYNNSSPITMEVAGGENDYGFALNPELPFETGPYPTEGYFTTTDYLDQVNGSILVLMTNTTIPDDTGITVEFSEDNATWTLNDWEPLFGGFESIDLRELNWSSSMFLRYNLSTSDTDLTPRLYQSRLITTEGEVGPGIPGVNVTGEWIEYQASAINFTVGTHAGGDLNSTFDIDGDTWNHTEVVGAPGSVISINFTGVDPDAECIWVTIWYLYNGNLQHDYDIEMWNFTSSAWVDDGHIVDGVAFSWVNSTIYAMRIPLDFLSGGEVRVQLNHESPGNVNHDLFIDYVRLVAKVPGDVGVGAVSVTVVESDFPWIAIAIILMMVAYLLFRPK